MKKLLGITLLSLTGILFLNACDSKAKPEQITIESKAEKTEVLAENKEAVEMKVEGMVCAMGCAKYIEDKVAELDGVVASSVDFEDGIARFEFDKTATSSKEIKGFINDIHEGQYKASLIKDKKQLEDAETVDTDKESLGSVAEKVNLSFPELFTYFIKRIR